MSADATFPSRVDAWLAMLVLGSLGLTVYQAWALHATAPQESLLAAGIALGVFVLVLALTWPCNYTLTDTHLVVRAGIVRHRIAYRDITSAQPSRSLWAGPALSLRRVRVTYAGRFVLISPRERKRFIEELQRRIAQSTGNRDAPGSAKRFRRTCGQPVRADPLRATNAPSSRTAFGLCCTDSQPVS